MPRRSKGGQVDGGQEQTMRKQAQGSLEYLHRDGARAVGGIILDL